MNQLGIILTSSATGICLLWWLSHKQYKLSARSPFPWGLRACFLENIRCFLEGVPCFWEMSVVFWEMSVVFWEMSFVSSGKVLCSFWSIGHCVRGFLRQSRLCMEGDNNWVINCELYQSFALSRARVRAYRQEFNDFCCHICHMYILNHYISVRHPDL